VPADGTLRAEVFNPAVTLGDGETGISGRALMIHAEADDYRSQPSGDAGARLACAVIE
jgi:Cu-Zn family superoxide dismutase